MLSTAEKQIINQLRVNSRKQLTSIAKELNIPLSTAHDRLYRTIRKHGLRLVSIPKFSRLKLPIHTWMFIQTKNKEKIQQILKEDLHVNTALSVHTNANFACEAVFKDFLDYDAFLRKIEVFGEVIAHPVLEVICQEKARIDY